MFVSLKERYSRNYSLSRLGINRLAEVENLPRHHAKLLFVCLRRSCDYENYVWAAQLPKVIDGVGDIFQALRAISAQAILHANVLFFGVKSRASCITHYDFRPDIFRFGGTFYGDPSCLLPFTEDTTLSLV